MKEETLPAIDSQELREKQLERFTEGIGNLGDLAKDMKKSIKTNSYINIITGIFIIIVIGGVFIYQLSNGGIDSIIDRQTVVRRFNCSSGDLFDTVRTYDDAKTFVELYGGECIIYRVSEIND